VIQYRLATQDDNDQLLELTAASGMTGEIALRIDRHPDFFQLLKLRGESKVFVAVDDSNIVGSLSVSQQQVFLGGEIHSLLYIGDFKVAEAYRNKSIGGQLCDELAKYVISIDADLAFLNVSKGNNKPFSFFRDRPGFPDFNNIGVFHIHQLVGKKQKNKLLSYIVEAHNRFL
jgi:ribosomal protein S18 acetylase RimI-like enzyme